VPRSTRPPGSGASGDILTTSVQELHPISDIRFVIREVGELSAKVERLISDVNLQTQKIGGLERSVDRFRTAAIVTGILVGIFLPAMAGIFWWAVGEKINQILRPAQTMQMPAAPIQKP
jgi:hypothetical protein